MLNLAACKNIGSSLRALNGADDRAGVLVQAKGTRCWFQYPLRFAHPAKQLPAGQALRERVHRCAVVRQPDLRGCLQPGDSTRRVRQRTGSASLAAEPREQRKTM